MRTVWLDDAFRCHAQEAPGLRAAQTELFDGKCDAFLEGYRLVPEGERWVREDGAVFRGEMIAPWRELRELEQLQRDHERQLLAEYAAALKELGVEV